MVQDWPGSSIEAVFDSIVTNISLLLYVLMIIVVGFQIGARWIFEPVFGQSLPWTVNLSQFLLVYVTFIGAAVASGKHEHISLDLLVTRVSDRSLRVLIGLRTVLALVFIGVLLRGAYPLYIDNQGTSIGALPTHAPFTQGWLYISVLIGGLIIVVYSFRDLWQAITNPEAVLKDLKREETDEQ